jgi:hypothetical protein
MGQIQNQALFEQQVLVQPLLVASWYDGSVVMWAAG